VGVDRSGGLGIAYRVRLRGHRHDVCGRRSSALPPGSGSPACIQVHRTGGSGRSGPGRDQHGLSPQIRPLPHHRSHQGALDTLSGFLVEISILVLVLVLGDPGIDLDSADLAWGLILAIVLVLVVGGVAVVRRVGRCETE